MRRKSVPVVILLWCLLTVTYAATLPGCTANTACTISTAVQVTTSTVFAHTALIVIDSGGSVTCTASNCRLDFTTTDTLRVIGTIRAAYVAVNVKALELNSGAIDVSGLGSAAGVGPGAGASATSSSGGGAGYGGKGRDGCAIPHPAGGRTYGSATSIVDFMGSGGGDALDASSRSILAGGRGGGVIVVDAQTMTVAANGALKADGQNGFSSQFAGMSGGGGSGGTVIVRVTQSWGHDATGGILSANGGHSSYDVVAPGGTAGGGGGGRIFITSPAEIPPNLDTSIRPGGAECGYASYGSVMKAEGHRVCLKQVAGTLFSCTCQAGFNGTLCDRCASQRYGDQCQFECPDCGAHGVCSGSSDPTASGCTCSARWAGRRCDECASGYYGLNCDKLCVNCGAHATCADGRTGDGRCICQTGWTGTLCDACTTQYYGITCQNKCPDCGAFGTCDYGFEGTGTCKCAVGWAGTKCDKCAPGYYGPSCSFKCADCGAHATCKDGFSGTGCTCDSNWRRPTPADQCTQCQVGYYGPDCAKCPDCGAHGSCFEGTGGTGTCICESKFYGKQCDQQCPVCSSHGICNDGRNGNGTCVCSTGWAGKLCTECAQGFYGPQCELKCPDCGFHGMCKNLFAGGGCDCLPNWRRATANDACLLCAPGYYGVACQSCPKCGLHGTCDDGVTGTGQCKCDPGWYGLLCNQTCTDCSGHGTCSDGRTGTGRCTCGTQYAGNNCQSCAPAYYGLDCSHKCPDCGPHAHCSDGRNGTGCMCDIGWARSSAGGNCDTCAPGYYGATCTKCKSCGDHGSCRDGMTGDGRCNCDANWSGGLCDECAQGHFGRNCDGVCGTCAAPTICYAGRDGNGLCICPGGLSGASCSQCKDNWVGPQCDECAPGYFGPRCLPCKCEHGTCDQGVHGTGSCTCGAPRNGTLCEDCHAGYWGPACTKCSCPSNAKCDDRGVGTGRCICPAGLAGPTCTDVVFATYCGSHACIPGYAAFEHGYDLMLAAVVTTPAQQTTMSGSSSPATLKLGSTTYTLPAGVTGTSSTDQMFTSSLKVIGTSHDAQDWVLGYVAGVESTASVASLPRGAQLHEVTQSILADLATGRFVGGMTHTVQVGTLEAAPLSSAWQFDHAAANLPETYDNATYWRFLQTYGTHVPVKLVLGGRVSLLASAYACESVAKLAADAGVVAALEMALSSGVVDAPVSVPGRYSGLTTHATVVGGDQTKLSANGLDAWAASVVQSPAVIGMTLQPIPNLVSDPVIRANLVKAISLYGGPSSDMQVLTLSLATPSVSGCTANAATPQFSVVNVLFTLFLCLILFMLL